LILSCLILILAAGVALLVLAVPLLQANLPLPVALVLLYLGIGLSRKLPRQAPGLSFLWLVLAALVLVPFAITARGFGTVDMMAFLFHTQFGLGGGSILTLRQEIAIVLLATLIFLLATWSLMALLRPYVWLRRPVLPVALALILAINPLSAHALRSAADPAPDLRLAEAMEDPRPTREPDPLPDIVYIYLEGLDQRFADRAKFGDAYDPIRHLAAQGLSLTNVAQISGTSWSLAGMVASQCGVPLLPRRLMDVDNLREVSDFLPRLTCLTDLLAERGYAQEFLVGGEEDFGGIDSFYRSHGVTEIWGKRRHIRNHPEVDVAAAYMGWVVDDQMVYDTARARFDAMAAAPAPFALIVETYGPHGGTSSLSRRCTPEGRATYTEDYGRSARCLGDLTVEFVDDIRARHAASGRPNPLRIILQSDHLFHARTELDTDPALERNTVILLGGPEIGVANDTAASMVDVYPTLLHWMGFGTTAAGLGRSVLPGTDEATLVAIHGAETVSHALEGAGDLSDRLWHE
jgi:phosphoglycerol transferase